VKAYQFNWSHEIVAIAGITTTVKVAHVRLCLSWLMLGWAYPREIEPLSAIGPGNAGKGRDRSATR
jgi:hypothetical protein